MMEYESGKLAPGWPVAVANMSQGESACVGLWFASGSRYETKALAGASHFVEHLLFKGTQERTAKEISQAVEGVGGYLNAFTSEEMTCYYAAATARHLPLLLEVLLDMVMESTFPPSEVERERGVILEEIKMYEDQPGQVASEALNRLVWPESALGRPIGGTFESVSRMTREQLLAHRARWYSPTRLSISVAGNTRLSEVASAVERLRKKSRKVVSKSNSSQFSKTTMDSGQTAPRIKVVNKPVEQTHLAMGFRGLSRHDPRRFALKLASVVLGENMSSRLFQIIREKHGLAYAIGSGVSYFSDAGLLSVSAGVENKRVTQALDLILKTVRALAQRGPTKGELQRAKDYVTGQMWMGLESSANQMMWMGEAMLGYGKIHSPREIEKRMQSVTAQELQQALAFLAMPERLSLAVVGPEPDPKALAAILNRW